MRAKFILLLISILSFNLFGQNDSIIISEVMFNAESGNNEFVELYNACSTPFDLSGYKIKYFWDYRDTIKALSQGMIIPPKNYAVILENDYDISTGIYKNIIPPEAIILVIDNAFGSGGMADGNTRYIDLLDNTNQLVQRYTYSPNNLTAHSDEIILRNKDTSASNWGNSISYNGSPGKANTIIKYYDELLLSSSYYPNDIIEGDFVKFKFIIKNEGVNNSLPFSLKVYNDFNYDSIPGFEELVINKNFTSLSSADSIIYIDSIAALIGDNNIISILEYAPDENPTNNKTLMSYFVRVRNDFNELIINEVKYNPLDNEGEWIEIYNRTNELINLRGWKLADNAQALTITNDSVIIYPHEYVVLTSNLNLPYLYKYEFRTILANLPQLNNDGDVVVLKDDYNKVIDSMIYRVTNTSIKNSVERVNFDSPSTDLNSWRYSIDRLTATPGRINSISSKNIDLIIQTATPASSYFIVEGPFSINYTLHNYGFQNSSTSKLKMYNDINGDSVFSENELLNEISIPDVYAGSNISGTITAEGLKEGINSLKLLINYSFDNDSLNNDYYLTATGVKINEIKNDIIINEIMYA
ncbi:MAG: lamin tail domain-containing protein, partial [Syntrophothermus sp.]